MQYHDFSIHFERADGGLNVRVLDSPAGEGRGASTLAQIPQQLIESSSGWLPAESAEEVGTQLFRGIFQGQVRELYDQSIGMLAAEEERYLRLVLRLDPTDPGLGALYSLPWELLYKPETREFLALSREFSIVRHLEVPRPARTMPLPFPLRVLVVASSPKGLPPLDLDSETSSLRTALASTPGVEIHILSRATLAELRRKLLAEPFHVVHFIGHGYFSADTGVGQLLFEELDHSPARITGHSLATFLTDFKTIRLVVLNACRTAQATNSDRANPFSGVATALVLCGVPAVVAMQFPITDKSAISFSSAFYSRLVDGDPVDCAVAEGRFAIFAQAPETLEWATPALFLRVSGGNIFMVQRGGARPVPDMREAARTAVESEITEMKIGRSPLEKRENESVAVNHGSGHVSDVSSIVVGTQAFNYEKAFDGVQESTLFVLRQVELAYEQTRGEARKWSSASLIAAGCGLLMIVATLVSLLTGKIEIGTISAIGSVIPTVISGLFFTQSRSAGKRLGFIVEELSAARKTHFAQEIARTMETPAERDKAKGAIVVALLETSGREKGLNAGKGQEGI